MLILSLKEGESVQIGDDISVMVARIQGTHVAKLGFDAPKDVKILRHEVMERDNAATDAAGCDADGVSRNGRDKLVGN